MAARRTGAGGDLDGEPAVAAVRLVPCGDPRPARRRGRGGLQALEAVGTRGPSGAALGTLPGRRWFVRSPSSIRPARILDACRNNPLAGSTHRTVASRSVSGGSFGQLNEHLLGNRDAGSVCGGGNDGGRSPVSGWGRDDEEADRGSVVPLAAQLGWMYREGRGVRRDDEEAVRFVPPSRRPGTRQCAAQPGCTSRVGACVRTVWKAARWYRLAADQGHADAQERRRQRLGPLSEMAGFQVPINGRG